MEISGKLIKIFEKQTGTSKKGKDWVKQEFVIDTGADFNPEICCQLFGEDKISMLEKLKAGQQLNVSINLSSREFKGKYYHNIDAWKISADEMDQDVESEDLPF
tara:strand:+ start:18497 stop:18808 length:312 start_codon:yes stop_codon:yes gene_type:complete